MKSTGNLTVNRATATLSLSNLSQVYNGTPRPVTITTSPAGISGTSATYNGSTTVPKNVGTYAVVASLNNTNYTADPVNGTLEITNATPVITWNNPSDITYGTALSGTQLNAVANVNGSPIAGTMAYTPAAGTVLQAGPSQTLSVVFTPSDSNYSTASKSVVINVSKATPTVTISGGTYTYDKQPHAATASVTGVGGVALGAASIAYTPGGSTVPVNAGTYKAVASFAGDSNYTSASSSEATITINKATPVVTASGGTYTYDATAHPATATVTGVGGETLGSATFTYTPGGASAPINAGTYSAVAAYAGDTNYEAANSAAACDGAWWCPLVARPA